MINYTTPIYRDSALQIRRGKCINCGIVSELKHNICSSCYLEKIKTQKDVITRYKEDEKNKTTKR